MQVLLWITVFWFAYAVSLLLRGLIHVGAARALGLDVQTLYFGYSNGKEWWKGKNVSVWVGRVPTWAHIGIHSRRTRRERRRRYVSGFIALAANGALAFALWPPNFVNQTASGHGPIFLDGPFVGAVFLANLVLVGLGLGSPSSYDLNPEDVSGEPLVAASEQQEELMTETFRIAESLHKSGKPASAAQWLCRSLRNHEIRSNYHYMSYVASIAGEYGDPDIALKLYREVLEKVEHPFPGFWREASDGFASLVLYRQYGRLLPEALTVIDKAIAMFPDSITLYGTRGGIHFELGNHEEAARDLRYCNESLSELDQGISSAFLAAIAARKGNTSVANRYVRDARRLAGDHVVVKRVLASMRPHDKSAPTRA